MAGRLSIIDVAVTGLARALRSLPGLLAIYWLPWMLGTIVLLIVQVMLLALEAMTQDPAGVRWATAWASELVWAPFAAMTYLMLLRWMLNSEPPGRPINLDVGRQTWIATPVVALLLVADATASDAPMAMLRWLPSNTLAGRWEDAMPYVLAFRALAWLANGALFACLFSMIVVVAQVGWPDLGAYQHLLRLQPLRLLCIFLLATAAIGGLRHLGWEALAWLGAGQLQPSTMLPWRAYMRQAFVAQLPYFPLHFLEFAIEGSILAEAYRRLLAQPQAPQREAVQT